MKRFYSILCAVALCFGILGSFPAQAVGNSPSSNQELFSIAAESDAETSQLVSTQLYQNFITSPESFLNDLSGCSDELQDTVSDFLTWEAYWSENADDYRAVLQSAADSPQPLAADLLAQLDAYTAEQEGLEDGTPETSMPRFDAETVKLFIDSNLAASNPYIDEEFCKKAAEWYATDPVLFAEILTPYSEQEITRIGNQISYAVSEKGAELPSLPIAENLDDNAQKTFSLLQNSIQKGLENRPFRTEGFRTPEQAVRSTQVPSIGSIVYSSTVVGSTPVSVTLKESTATNIKRTYYVEVYQVRNGTSYKKASAAMSIPAGSSSATQTFAVTTYETGVLYTNVKVYSAQGGSLLASRTGAYSDTFTGKWRIQIDLYTSLNRKGDLGLYNASGTLMHHAYCLGRSASNASESVTNGNTPRGNYTGYLDGPKPVSQQDAYGPYKYVRLTPLFSTTRSGFLIHGGRSQTTLTPTNGCVRVFNADQKKIQDIITTMVNSQYHNRVGNVNIKVI